MIHANVFGRARSALFIVGNYLKTRSFVSLRVMCKDLDILATQAGCCLAVLGWKKFNPKSRRGRYHR